MDYRVCKHYILKKAFRIFPQNFEVFTTTIFIIPTPYTLYLQSKQTMTPTATSANIAIKKAGITDVSIIPRRNALTTYKSTLNLKQPNI